MMLSMAIQPQLNVSLKSCGFPLGSNGNNKLMFKASNALSLHSARSASTKLRRCAVAVAVPEQSSAPEESPASSPPDVEVPFLSQLRLLLLLF